MADLECDLCGRHAENGLSFNCCTCARSALYNLRIEVATALLDKEQAQRRVEAVHSGDVSQVPASTTLDGAIVDMRDCSLSDRMEEINTESEDINEHIEGLVDLASDLKKRIEEYKKKVAGMKTVAAREKSDAESAGFGLEGRSASEVDQIQKSIRQTKRRWDIDYNDIIRGRVSLCRNAARLAGLRKLKTVEGQSMREHFRIARDLPIFDLREMNGADPEILTASLTQLAYLVARVSTYLAIRLPAQVVLPHKDHPLPVIYPPGSSYLYPDGVTSPNNSRPTSPSISKIFDQRITRPRPLSVSKSLPKLHKEDPVSFSIFVEGVTLLAWNIAWLCKTQGMNGLSSWTDICSMGRNLWQLLMADNRGAIKVSNDRDKTTPTASVEENKARASNLPAQFGRNSHGSAHSFFGTKEGAEIMRGWKLQTPTKAMDRVKAHLLG